jgi:hypothetical protein
LIADFTAVAITHERAVMGATHDDKARAWGRQEKYCQSIRCSNFYMDGLGKQEKILMLGAFAMMSDLENSQGDAMGHWLREQSGLPSHMWYRPSGQRVERTQQRMQIMILASFYQDSFKPFERKIPNKSSKKPYHFQSSMKYQNYK